MSVIDGNAIASQILEDVKQAVSEINGRKPSVAFIRVGHDAASVSYVLKKQMKAKEVGIESRLLELPETITQQELFDIIDNLNADATLDGILVQSPLPSHIDEKAVFSRVSPLKDVDGFHPMNVGKVCQEDPSGFVACTPAGILEMLKQTGTDIEGKHVVIIGRSLIVGKPLALLFLQKSSMGNATVTVCHSKTKNLKDHTLRADILIAAMGKPNFVTADMVKEGAVVIDVGVNRIPDTSRKSGYYLTGDVDFKNVAPKVAKITPVPKGVGPMTVAMLMKNTLKSYYHGRER